MADPTPFLKLALHQLTVDTTTQSGKPTWTQKEEDLKAVHEAPEMVDLLAKSKQWATDHPESSYEVK